MLTREWRRFRDSFDAETIIDSCRPAAAVVPWVCWVSAILVFYFIPRVNRLVGLTELVLPVVVTSLAGIVSILSWGFGRTRRNVLAALQFVENFLYSAAFLSTAAYSSEPASYVMTGFFAVSCLYWGISFSFTVVGFVPLVGSVVFLFLTKEVDPICLTVFGVGLVFFYSMGSVTSHRRSHRAHALRSEDVLNRLETLMSSCRSGVVAEMEVKMASVAHRVRTCLHAAADDVKELGRGEGAAGPSAITPVLRNLESTVSVLDDFLEGLRVSAQAAPSFHLPKLASGVEPANKADAERLEWSALPDVWVTGQEGMIAISLQSLVDNALEAGAGAVRIEVEEQGDLVALTVVDDGPGLPAQVRNNLFRPYNTFGKSRGVGLGIYLAAQIVRSSGGGIELVATGARGTRFKVTLPITELNRTVRIDTQRRLRALEIGDG